MGPMKILALGQISGLGGAVACFILYFYEKYFKLLVLSIIETNHLEENQLKNGLLENIIFEYINSNNNKYEYFIDLKIY